MAGNSNSGRKSKTIITREIEQGLKESALIAEQKLKFSLRGTDNKGRKFKPLSLSRIKECELVIAHAIGTPRQKINLDVSGEVLTLHQLASLAFQEPEKLPEPQGQQPMQDIIEGEYEPIREDTGNQPDSG